MLLMTWGLVILETIIFKHHFFIKVTETKTGFAECRNYLIKSYDKGHLCSGGDIKFDINECK